MSTRMNRHFKQVKIQFNQLKDFNHSVDVKRFSREKNSLTPSYAQTPSFQKKIQFKSNQKIRQSQPASFSSSLSKHISQKNMKTKRKLSSGFQIIKTNHHSVSIDHHLLKEKYNAIKETFEEGKHMKVVPLIRHSILHFEYSQEQKNLYLWLTLSLGHLQRYDQALEQISQCLQIYSSYYEGLLLSGELNLKLKQFKLAQQQIQAAIRLQPKNPQSYLQLSYCYSQTGQLKKQKSLLQQTLQKFPKQLPILIHLLECCLSLPQKPPLKPYLLASLPHYTQKDSQYFYIKGLLQKQQNNPQQAYILFQESVTFNSNKMAVNKSLLQIIKIQIQNRDFYKAYHSVGRIKHLQLQQSQEIKIYTVLIEGVMTMMKKKSKQAIEILLRIVNHKKCQQLNIHSLLYKYLAYGYFKVEQYAKSIKYYQKIPKNQLDISSQYNKLIAQGIELCDTQLQFNQALDKFKNAAKVYPQKVEPYIYMAMTYIYRFNVSKSKDQIQKAETLIDALKEMENAHRLNPNSSNLLYHRTIIHLYFEDWTLAHQDINKCIQKAQQNLPKYFYLRGVCYSCVREFKKAINEFSICLSLDAFHQQSYFEKAKCYFLLGNTQKGFDCLKSFIELNPDNNSIYKWIGDLLYEGKSYNDALKSYSQSKCDNLQYFVMKCKCLFRVGSLNQIGSQLRLIQRMPEVQKNRIFLDLTSFSLLNALVKHQSSKVVISSVHKLNKLLQQNVVGYIFQLIDCMNLLGVASFYLQKYQDAYESFLLVMELHQSLCEKDTTNIKIQDAQEELDLRSQDIYFNIIVCELARKHLKEAFSLIQTEYINIVEDPKQKKKVMTVMNALQKQSGQTMEWEFRTDKPVNAKLRRVDLECGKLKLRTKPVFSMYHESAENLYASDVADKIIKQFKAGYIDTMPEGPWIKRNPFGVVFTEEVMPSENSISLDDTFRQKQSEQSFSNEDRFIREQTEDIQDQKKTISKKEQFLRKLQFQDGVEEKLKKMMNSNKDI